MGTNSLPAPPAPRRRSFSLPSFRRSWAAERQEVLKKADDLMARSNSVQEEAARIQKAAAWQWYTRGLGETVVLPRPTRPPAPIPQAPISDVDKSCVGASSTANVRNSNTPEENPLNPPPLAKPHRAASRFKAETRYSFTGPPPSGAVPTLPAAPSGRPSTPLYDELEISSLRTHMADLVQQLQHHEHSSPARPPPPPVSIDHQQTKTPPAVAVALTGNHQQLTTLPRSPAPVASTVPFHIKPFSALQKLLSKVLYGSVPKCSTKDFPQFIDAASSTDYEPAEVHNDVDSTYEYHHHHYIHHHHHHYHFSRSPEEQASTILSRRRHSESGIRPCTPALVEASSDNEEDQHEVEEERIAAYLARRRRRHSENFFRSQLLPEDANSDKDEGSKEEFAQVKLPKQFWRRYTSERFSASRTPTMAGKNDTAQAVEDKFDEGTFAAVRSRRRHSAELHREQPSLARTGGKSKSGAYVLGGAGAGSGTAASVSVGRRRHSESSKGTPEAGAKQKPSPGRPYWISPSARYYYVDVQERHIGVPTPANAATTAA